MLGQIYPFVELRNGPFSVDRLILDGEHGRERYEK